MQKKILEIGEKIIQIYKIVKKLIQQSIQIVKDIKRI